MEVDMNKTLKMGCGVVILVVIIMAVYGIGSYNGMVTLEEGVNEKWSQVENVYQRRLDLIPNLVETVKGYAAHETETLQAVTEARAKLGGTVNIGEQALKDPAVFQKFQQAQASLSSALQRLMVVVERYPDLKANENFLQLQSQLEGTENRIAVERKRFNEAARSFNIYIKKFPKVIMARMFGFNEKPYFKAAEGADVAPKVKF
jgi:LemA protein